MVNQKKVKARLTKNFRNVCIKLKKEGFLLCQIAESCGMSNSYMSFIKNGTRPVSFKHIQNAVKIKEIDGQELFRGLDEEEIDFVQQKIDDLNKKG